MPAADENGTIAYLRNNLLNFKEAIGDGFYDPGRSRPEKSLAAWRSEPVDLEGREVILVQIQPLKPLVEDLATQIAAFTNTDEKFKAIAQTCSVMLGDTAAMREVTLAKNALREIKQRLRSNVVPLHELRSRAGVCRHRAILFKVLCDELSKRPEHGPDLRCRLVRGDYESDHAGGGHAWNVVRSSGVFKLCDVMHQPGKLYDDSSDKASHYKRLLGGAYGGMGGNSVPVPVSVLEDAIRWKDLSLGDELGRGGFGVVYTAKCRQIDVTPQRSNSTIPSARLTCICCAYLALGCREEDQWTAAARNQQLR